MAIKLTIPKQLPGRSLSIGNGSNEIAAWLDGLSTEPDETAARQILPVLIESNRIEMSLASRYQLLKGLMTRTSQILAALQAKTRLATYPVTDPKSTLRMVLSQRLMQEMAYGFKLFTSDLVRSGAQDSPYNIEAIYGAIHFLGKSLLEHYINYEPVTENLWGELNLLYRLALRGNIERLSIAFTGGQQISIDHAYKQLALLSAINPYRLLRGEAEKVYDLMATWCDHCELKPRPPGWEPRGEVVIDFAGDRSPSHARPGTKILDVSNLRVMDISKIHDYLKQAFDTAKEEAKQSSAGRMSIQLQRDMLKRLVEGWQGVSARNNDRVQNSTEMDMVVGMAHCYALYSKTAETEVADIYSFANLSLVPKNDIPGSSFGSRQDGVFKIDDPNTNIWHEKNIRIDSKDIEHAKGPTTYPVTRFDVSEGGYGLRLNLDAGMDIKVGDIVALRLRGADHTPWALADVRWKRTESENIVTFGVRLLSPIALPFEATVITGRGEGSRAAGGVVIPAEGFDHPEANLILPASVYDEGTTLNIWSSKCKLIVTLNTQLETTHGFSRFTFDIVKKIN